MVEHTLVGSARRHATTDPTSFVEHLDREAMGLEYAGCKQTADSSADHHDINL
jgi:hypothetical protein